MSKNEQTSSFALVLAVRLIVGSSQIQCAKCAHVPVVKLMDLVCGLLVLPVVYTSTD